MFCTPSVQYWPSTGHSTKLTAVQQSAPHLAFNVSFLVSLLAMAVQKGVPLYSTCGCCSGGYYLTYGQTQRPPAKGSRRCMKQLVPTHLLYYSQPCKIKDYKIDGLSRYNSTMCTFYHLFFVVANNRNTQLHGLPQNHSHRVFL